MSALLPQYILLLVYCYVDVPLLKSKCWSINNITVCVKTDYTTGGLHKASKK